MTVRPCANCGEVREVVFIVRDPLRSLCSSCYADVTIRHMYRDGLMTAHPRAQDWVSSHEGREWVRLRREYFAERKEAKRLRKVIGK